MTLRGFLTGPPSYVIATSGWAPRIVLTTVVILVSGIAAAAAFSMLLASNQDVIPSVAGGGGSPPGPAGAAVEIDARRAGSFMLTALVSQAAIVALTLLAALRPGWPTALKLKAVAEGWRVCAFALLVMVPLLAVFNGLVYLVARGPMLQDFNNLRDLARSEALLPTALVLGIGAPASEELLFRGYLLSSLAATRLGYWPSAFLATLGWTLLHLNYSWVGMLEVFLIGSYFSWLLWRTGSIVPALACHAIYNSSLLTLLRLWPD